MADWMDLLSTGANWLLQQQDATNAQNAQNAALSASNAASTEAAKIAAEESRFRPIGMTNYFGSSNFQMGPDGRLQSAGYELNPYLQQLLERTQAGAPGNLAGAEAMQTAAGGLFNLGQQYLAQSPEAASQAWMQQQQELMRPEQERAYAQVQQNLANSGRGGLSVAQGGSLQNTNPEMAAYYNALAQRDKQLALQADEYGRTRTNYGASLFSTGGQLAAGAYAPLTANLGTAQGINQLGQSAFDTGVALGGKNANPTGSEYLAKAGAVSAANLANIKPYQTQYAPLAAGATNWFGSTK